MGYPIEIFTIHQIVIFSDRTHQKDLDPPVPPRCQYRIDPPLLTIETIGQGGHPGGFPNHDGTSPFVRRRAINCLERPSDPVRQQNKSNKFIKDQVYIPPMVIICASNGP